MNPDYLVANPVHAGFFTRPPLCRQIVYYITWDGEFNNKYELVPVKTFRKFKDTENTAEYKEAFKYVSSNI